MQPVFPAIYSTLDPLALSRFITQHYAIGQAECSLLVRGVGDTYLVQTADQKFIFRVYRPSHRNLAAIQAELQLLLTLKKQDVPVSFPLPASNGSYIQQFDAAEGQKHGVLFSYAPGRSVNSLNENQLRELGRSMAQFHLVSETLPAMEGRWNFDLDTLIWDPLKKAKDAFAEDQAGYEWLQSAASQVQEELSKLDTGSFARGYCHFDFLPKNFHFDEKDQICFFDFDFFGHGWLINDIMIFWQHLRMEIFFKRSTRER